jgi:ABC transport system ATP-binding/permease protein
VHLDVLYDDGSAASWTLAPDGIPLSLHIEPNGHLVPGGDGERWARVVAADRVFVLPVRGVVLVVDGKPTDGIRLEMGQDRHVTLLRDGESVRARLRLENEASSGFHPLDVALAGSAPPSPQPDVALAGSAPPSPQLDVAQAYAPSTLTIGSGPDANFLVDAVGVAPIHASLLFGGHGGGATLVDRGRGAGTFVGGVSVAVARLDPGDEFTVGPTTLRYIGAAGTPLAIVAPRPLSVHRTPAAATAPGADKTLVAANALTVARGARSLPIIVNASFVVPLGQVSAVLGPSGVGKSTLLKTFLGEVSVIAGSLRVSNVELCGRSLATLKRFLQATVAFVPQDDDFLMSLHLRETLVLAGLLRSAPGTGRSAVVSRADKLLAQIGLSSLADAAVVTLSGGERKRASIGVELMGQPQLLLLDEPTSGLDAASEDELLSVVRRLSADGATVVFTTHSAASVDRAEWAIAIARGGAIAYSGAVERLRRSVAGAADANWVNVLRNLGRRPVGRDPEPVGPSTSSDREADASLIRRRMHWRRWAAQLSVLIERQTRVVWRRSASGLAPIIALPLVGALIAAAPSPAGLGPSGFAEAGALAQTVSIYVTVLALGGTALTYSDLVAERAALKRDWRAGVSSGQIVLSKLLVFGLMSFVVATLAAAIFLLLRPGPSMSLFPFGGPLATLAAQGTMVMWASASFGLLIGGICRRLEVAVVLQTLLALAQVSFNGLFFHLGRGTGAISWLFPARWGVAIFGASMSMNSYRGPHTFTDRLWNHTAPTYAFGWAVLAALTLVTAASAVYALERSFVKRD